MYESFAQINLECSDELKMCVYCILQQWGQVNYFGRCLGADNSDQWLINTILSVQ